MKEQYIDQYGIDSLPHLKRAAQMRIEIFVTSNEELLADKEELEKLFLIKIRRPSEVGMHE